MLVLPDGLLEYLRASSGGIVLHIAESPDAVAVERGLRAAARRIDAIRHPEEPTESFANSVYSSATELHADMPDVYAFDGILEAVVAAFEAGLAEAGVTEGVVRIGPDPDAEPVVKGPKRPFEMPADFPLPADTSELRWDTRNHDTGGVQLTASMPFDEVVEFYREALPRSGYEITAVEPGRYYDTRQGEFEGTTIRLRWPGWEGRVTTMGRADLSIASVSISLRTALTFEQARRDSGVDVTPRRRTEFRSEWSERVPAIVVPSDLGPGWIVGNVSRRSSGCFCDRDTVIRKGPNEKRGLMGGGGALFGRDDAACWIEASLSSYESEQAARDLWKWVPLDLKYCEEFRGKMPVGKVEDDAAGRWREVSGNDPDRFDGDVIYNTRSAGQVAGRMSFVIVDRFIAKLFAHAVVPEPVPGVEPLITLVRERLHAIARDFPPPPL